MQKQITDIMSLEQAQNFVQKTQLQYLQEEILKLH